MVWFQCEDCGENLKKPKLLMHFNRCSAYKLSCIDCGVVFNQQSVQAHSSCVSEAEKYGPKGLNKGVNGPASNAKNSKVNGSDVDFSRGLSTFPPWSCSLCNVKATSQETLEIHGQGKKHQNRAKAASAKEKSKTQEGGDAAVSADVNVVAFQQDVKAVESKEATQTAVLDPTSPSTEKKRKKERVVEGGDHTSTPSGNVEKKLKRGTSAVVGTPSTDQEGERLPESGKDSQDKKRKLVEEHATTIVDENGQGSGKKNRKKGKLAPGEVNGLGNDVSGSPATVGKDENVEQVKKKEKGLVQQQDDACEVNQKEKKKKSEGKEPNVHEVSFREWLGEDEGKEGGTPTHPPLDINGGKGNLAQPKVLEKTKSGKLRTDATQEGIAKVVKWKKIIRDLLGKLIQSLNGKLKKKDLQRAVLPLAQEAIKSASISVDRKALKAELMRQVNTSPKFVVDGKHVMLAPKV